MEYYKVSKKTMRVLGSVLNDPKKWHTAKVFYIPRRIWHEWNPNGDVALTEQFEQLSEYDIPNT